MNKINWLRVKEPLRGVCKINTVDGLMQIPMHEPSDEETKDILKIWPTPQRPMKAKKTPRDVDGRQIIETTYEPDDSPEAMEEWREKVNETSEWQALAYAEAAIDDGYKPEGATREERVKFLMSMPRAVRIKLINFAQSLGEKRLAERFEEAKKS